GSAGQQRTAAITLRLLEAATLQERRGGPPLILLDDPFAELDVPRTRKIVELLCEGGAGQTILAVPRESDIPHDMPRLQRFRISAGALRGDWPKAKEARERGERARGPPRPEGIEGPSRTG